MTDLSLLTEEELATINREYDKHFNIILKEIEKGLKQLKEDKERRIRILQEEIKKIESGEDFKSFQELLFHYREEKIPLNELRDFTENISNGNVDFKRMLLEFYIEEDPQGYIDNFSEVIDVGHAYSFLEYTFD